jgi:hypothetical protein
MKSIDTLVEDIYGLFKEGFKFDRESVDAFAHNLANRLGNRLAEERGKATLRMSNLGTKCRRQLWYKLNTPELATPLSPATRIKFLFGDILEELLFWLARTADHKVEREQEEVEINGVKGHLDGFIDGYLVDAKSASTFSFKKFRDHTLHEDDAFGYQDQLGAYGQATNEPEGAFLVIDKQHGHIALDRHKLGGKDYSKEIDEIRTTLASPTPPDRGFDDIPAGESGNRKLGTNCSYCDFKDTCWPGLRTIPYSNGPVFLTKVVREPKLRGSK